MNIKERFDKGEVFLMEGALGERLKREFDLNISGDVAMASLIYETNGRTSLRLLWLQYLAIAEKYGLPFIATTPTRRANLDRVTKSEQPATIIRDNVEFLREVLSEIEHPAYLGGLMGCRGDAYTGEGNLSEKEASEFHQWQADEFAKAGADYLFAGIMPTLPEAIGMAKAMANTGLPYIISFTIKPDGCLIDKTPIYRAIETIDAKIKNKPLCYMTNCIHPRFAISALEQSFNRSVPKRFKGVQANTAALEYCDMDGATRLKATSNAHELSVYMQTLKEQFNLQIFGGCCGTDHLYMEEIAKAISF